MSTRTIRASVLIVAWLMCGLGTAQAGPEEPEIEYLLTSIGHSGCGFVRNGEEHPASEAASHLRMKYRKGRRYIDSAEAFIEKAASGSSITGKPYFVRCPGEAEQTSASWLEARLREYRRGERDPAQPAAR